MIILATVSSHGPALDVADDQPRPRPSPPPAPIRESGGKRPYWPDTQLSHHPYRVQGTPARLIKTIIATKKKKEFLVLLKYF